MPILTHLPFQIDLPGLRDRLRLKPGSPYAAELAEMARLAQAQANPKALYQEYFIEARQGDCLTIGGRDFTSRALALNLAPVEKVYAYIVTAGSELDAFDPPAQHMLQKFCWDALKEEILGQAIHALDDYLRTTFQLPKTAVMNPGSGDADVWPLEQQRTLFDLLGSEPAQMGVSLGQTCLMSPVKTVSGVLFATQSDFRTCQVCRRAECRNRQAPFDRQLWESLHAG